MHPQRWIVPAALLVIWGLWGLMDDNPYGGFDWGDSVVISVEADGPADRAGLREGDRILSMGGIPLGDREARRREPRAEIGETRVLVVERTGEDTGVTTTENIEVTYSPLPTSERAFGFAGAMIGLVFLISGTFVYLRAPSTPSFLFAIVGLGWAAILLPSPYIGSYALRAFTANILFVVFFTGIASLLHLLLVFPKRKRIVERKRIGQLIYLPVVAFILMGIINFIAGDPSERPTFARYLLGILILGYMALSAAALIHSYVKATPHERSEHGLNYLLPGVLIGLLPFAIMGAASVFIPTDLLLGADFYFLAMALIPISFALALLKAARGASKPMVTESA